MSVQNLLNLIAPRTGDVDPSTCVQCATLRRQVRTANRSGNPAKALETAEAMRLHKYYGHPDETRQLLSDLPQHGPKVI